MIYVVHINSDQETSKNEALFQNQIRFFSLKITLAFYSSYKEIKRKIFEILQIRCMGEKK